ncbi:MAG: nuclear transport factor 2 family protein, partial [Chloroflexota bacterium]
MTTETSSGTRVLEAHVDRFNAGVRSGDFTPMVRGFDVDGRLEFVGIPVGPFQGRDEIAAAYVAQPPDDEIRLLSTEEPDDATVIGRYEWSRTGA